jgi:DNA-binding LacI/PurR family transcriptional regulator
MARSAVELLIAPPQDEGEAPLRRVLAHELLVRDSTSALPAAPGRRRPAKG